MTLLQYFNTPETVLPSELIDGIRYVADAPFVSHQRVVLKLATALQDHAASAGGEVLIAPVDVVLDERRPLVLQPDLLYLAPEQTLLALDRIYGAPALVVEILSPRPRIGDLNERVAVFAQYGVREIWVYDQPARALDVLSCADGRVSSRLRIDDGPIVSAVLPRFTRSMFEILGQW